MSNNVLCYLILLLKLSSSLMVRLHNFTFLSISILDLIIKSFFLYLPFNTLVTVELPISSKSAISLFDAYVYFLRLLMYSFLISDIWYSFKLCIPFYFIHFYFSDFFNDLWTCEDSILSSSVVWQIYNFLYNINKDISRKGFYNIES